MTESVSAEERLAKIKENNRQNSKSYYQRNYVIDEGMTEEQKEKVRKNIIARQEKCKNRYNAKKEHYKTKQKQYRERKRSASLSPKNKKKTTVGAHASAVAIAPEKEKKLVYVSFD